MGPKIGQVIFKDPSRSVEGTDGGVVDRAGQGCALGAEMCHFGSVGGGEGGDGGGVGCGALRLAVGINGRGDGR